MQSSRDSIEKIIRELQNEDMLNIRKFLILTTLYLLRRTTITDLSKILKIPLSTLQDLLKRLEELGYVKVRRKVITSRGVRTIVEITDRGAEKYLDVYNKLRILVRYLDSSVGEEDLPC